jgi:hypothetical protein
MRGDGRVFRRGTRWWLAYDAPQDGWSVEYREPGGNTKVEARRLLRQRLRDVSVHKTDLRAFQGPRQERVMVDDLLQALERDYQIQGRKFRTELRAHLRPLRAYLTLSRALSVTSERLRDYIA